MSDPVDRLARILGRVVIRDATVDSQLARVTAAGNLGVEIGGAVGQVDVSDRLARILGEITLRGNASASDARSNAEFAVLSDRFGGNLVPLVGPMGFNGATWDRIRSLAGGDVTGAGGIQGAGLYVRTPAGNANFVGSQTDGADALAVQGARLASAAGYNLVFNGATWDRLYGTVGEGARVHLRLAGATIDPRDVSDRAGRLLGLVMEHRAATQGNTQTGAVNTVTTLTLPAPGAGNFHYIVSLELVKLYNVVGVAAGAGVIITSTNMPGNPSWTTEQLASPAGTAVKVIKEEPTTPLRSLTANTATTFVAPAQLQTIWRWNVRYFNAP